MPRVAPARGRALSHGVEPITLIDEKCVFFYLAIPISMRHRNPYCSAESHPDIARQREAVGMDIRTLGQTDLLVPPMGVGTWAWGDRWTWGYGREYGRPEVEGAFWASLKAGLNFFDTAEIYGFGTSERILGGLIAQSGAEVLIATKFAPYRLTARSLHGALERSLQRLGLERADLYQIHFPVPHLRIGALMGHLAEAVQAGKVRAVGVSNFSAAQMRRAHAALARHGVVLASNQVEYSLLHRAPETDGLLQTCRELNVVLIAYSPLAMGLLAGKYRPGGRTHRRVRAYYGPGSRLETVMPVIDLLEQIGRAHGKTPSQGALNWLLRQPGVIPIPGAKSAQQAADNAGALGWEMTVEEAEALDRATRPWRK